MFNVTEFQKEITNLLFSGNLDKAYALLFSKDLEVPSSEIVRIERLKILYSQIKDFLNKSKNSGNLIHLKDIKEKKLQVTQISRNIQDILSLDEGVYDFENLSRLRSWFEKDFSNYSEKFKRRLRHSRFHVPIETVSMCQFRVSTNLRFCTSDPQMYAYVSDGYFDREQSGRLAKACPINFLDEAKEKIESALVLPIPHLYGNYYHVIAEMIYALRFCQYVPDDTKIVVGPDKFNLIDEFCNLLKIDKKRLIEISNCKNLLIEKAVIPSHPHYFWDKEVYKFFNKFSFDRKTKLKIYISRSFSSRSFKNEKNLEIELQKKGFIVLHSENLNFEQQRFFFSQAEIIIAPHGAGETNILFAKPGTKLIELFSEDFLCRDYYLRSRHINIDYKLLTYKEEIDINSLLELIS